jgi:ABC-type proline/glycine betaine transport system permease subunit
MIHWTVLVAVLVAALWAIPVGIAATTESDDPAGWCEIMGAFWLIPTVAFVLIWGGIFWW